MTENEKRVDVTVGGSTADLVAALKDLTVELKRQAAWKAGNRTIAKVVAAEIRKHGTVGPR